MSSTQKILEALKGKQKMTPKEISKATGLNYNTVRGALNRLLKKGLVKRVERGVYTLA
ncbi:MAG: winged helix-turn-helix transcriptional regulator [Desulfurococcales archaeon]|jgi:predicted transcriptional regulator of viral defense system|nr:winged helix-turn-helix domain-containing protein [Desulfurococcales archaeon]MCC6061858.1 winged helix-turn-helix domain-containing protein [Desulfurococcales archaeon]MCI4457077.1 winged helix-turn-helix transcriptional regulator [Desulfurococcaceae archaeon]NAZ13177.1 winged helix-turn-helix transcriptional regulator [Desulfurococcales archaeon]